MEIRTVTVDQAIGHIVAHHLFAPDGTKLAKKGTRLTAATADALRKAAVDEVVVAWLSPDEVDEDTAAARIGAALATNSWRVTRAAAGRVNLHAREDGVLFVEAAQLLAFNQLPGVTLATRPQHSVVGPRHATTRTATLKVIPYALPAPIVAQAEQMAAGLLTLRVLRSQRVALLVVAGPAVARRLRGQFERAIRPRLIALGSDLSFVRDVPPTKVALSDAARSLLDAADALIVVGATSVMGMDDTVPLALSDAGVTGLLHGAPVEPGNLLALGYRGGQWVLCAPGCARSPARNVVDLVLPRLIAGGRLGAVEIAALGVGGLL